MTDQPAHKVTIAICIHARTHLLAGLASALAQQEAAPDFVVLCVLNGASQAVDKETRAALSSCAFDARFVTVSEAGLALARNKAIAECRTKWLVFLDDDAIPTRDWLQNLVSEAERIGAKVAGGRVLLRWDVKRPEWFKESYDVWLSCVDMGKQTKLVVPPQYLVGANLIYDMEVFRGGLRFDTRLGRKGDDLLSDEETGLNADLRKSGIEQHYIGAALVWHVVAPERLSYEWVARRVLAQGRSTVCRLANCGESGELHDYIEKCRKELWRFAVDPKNYGPDKSLQWIERFARWAGSLWQWQQTAKAASSNGVSGCYENWCERQFRALMEESVKGLAKGSSVAIAGAGVPGEMLRRICEDNGVQILDYFDENESVTMSGVPTKPFSSAKGLIVDAVLLASLRSEGRLLKRLRDAGYTGRCLGASKETGAMAERNHAAPSFHFSKAAKPRDGIPGRDWPLNVQLQTISTCNARCVICPYPHSWQKANPGRMSDDLFETILSDLEQYSLGKVCLYLQNEPLSDQRWLEMARQALSRLKFERFELSTNSSLLTPEKADALCALLKGVPHEVWLSFQGCDKESYERIMGLNFERTLANILYFVSNAQQEGLSVRICGGGQAGSSNTPNLFTAEKFTRFVRAFEVENGLAEIPVRYFTYHDRAGGLNGTPYATGCARETLSGFYCHRIDTWLHVLYNGEVISCCNDYQKASVIGNLKESRIIDFFRSSPYREFRDKALGLLESDDDFICRKCAIPGG